jgi:hypothetical protein
MLPHGVGSNNPNYHKVSETARIRPLLNATKINRESAIFIARKMFETYDINGTGAIEENEARGMIIDSYTNVG